MYPHFFQCLNHPAAAEDCSKILVLSLFYFFLKQLFSFLLFSGDFEAFLLSGREMTGDAQGEGRVSLDLLKKKMDDFAKERDWERFHSPRNLLLALVGEVGELSEIFQWKGEVPKGLPDWKDDEKEHLGEELSDVLLYLVRLSDICGIDLGKAALRKVQLNAIKYPINNPSKDSPNKTIHVNDADAADN